MISSSAQFPGPDVDECTFPGPDALTSEFPGVDFAVVMFPPAPMPIIEGVAHFTGAGYLTVDIFGIANVAAPFSGSGSATADLIAWGGVKEAAAAFAGSGDFAVIARAVQQAMYSGAGSLSAQIATALAVTLSGSGQSTFTSSAIGITSFTLSGEGAATAAVIAVGGAYSVSANFTGEGSATANVVPAIAAGFAGSGSASASTASVIKALFSGPGSMAAKSIPAAPMLLSGAGTATASVISGPTVSAYTTFSKTTGSAVTITLPTANVGDLWVIAMGTVESQMGSTPSGWTKRLGNGSWNDTSIEVWTRTKVAGDPTTITTTASGFSNDKPAEVIAMTVSNQNGVNASSSVSSSTSTSATPHPTPAITTTVAKTVLIRMVSAAGPQTAAHTWPAGVTPITSVINGTSGALSVAVQTADTSGSQAAVNATPSTGSKYSSGTIAIAPV